MPKEDHHLEAVRRRLEQEQETRQRLEEQDLQEAEVVVLGWTWLFGGK